MVIEGEKGEIEKEKESPKTGATIKIMILLH